jgi:peptidoglycan-associated lipoprotein
MNTGSRRAFLLGISGLALAACNPDRFTEDAGARIDEGGFGNPTANNILIQTGQRPYVINLAERFAREVPDTVTFEFDSVALDGAARQVLLQQANWIRQFPEVRFRVFGHADLVGSSAYNRQLGLRRARAVVDFLVRNGVSRARLEAVISHGDTQPLIQTPDRERRNRRAVTEVAGFVQRHPTVLNGQYGDMIFRQYVGGSGTGSSAPPSRI